MIHLQINPFPPFTFHLSPAHQTMKFTVHRKKGRNFSGKIKPPLSFLSGDPCKVCNVGEQGRNLSQQGQPVGLDLVVLGHDHDAIEESINRLS